MRAARAGDDRAFGALVDRYATRAFAVARSVVGDADAAEDVCQDALFRVWQRLADCRDAERFGAWLLQAVRRHALNDIRARRLTSDLSHHAASGPLPDRAAELADLRRNLAAALGRLEPEQRQAVLLFDLEGWSHADIAAVLETSEAMSRQHLMLGRRRLRALLAKEDRT